MRTLLITVLAFSLPLSWFSMRMQRAMRQRDAISELAKLEVAFIEYDCHYDGSMAFAEDQAEI